MISKDFHSSRREAFASLMQDNTVELFKSGKERPERGDQFYRFYPDADFYYLTGYDQPGAILRAVKVSGKVTFILLIERTDDKTARWLGRSDTVESVSELTGIDKVLYTDDTAGLEKLMSELSSNLTVLDEHTNLGKLRQVKTKEETELIRKACQITTVGVEAILEKLQPGMYEYESVAYFDFVLSSLNADHAFATIAASGANACILHYNKNDSLMKEGDLVLYDLGAAWRGYCSDVSRTFPVNGTFSVEQKMLYEAVLKGLTEAINLVKPGQVKSELQNVSKKVMAEELVRIGKIKEESEIDRYYYHGSGHYIGLCTHDIGDNDAPLEQNMVFTLEPGLYFPEDGIGIRIEDTILVTSGGCEVLTEQIPRTVHEIELFMAKIKDGADKVRWLT